jgi:hypothetical protein
MKRLSNGLLSRRPVPPPPGLRLAPVRSLRCGPEPHGSACDGELQPDSTNGCVSGMEVDGGHRTARASDVLRLGRRGLIDIRGCVR